MIKNKKDLKYYLSQDKLALHIDRKHPKLFGSEIWKYEISLRKLEYWVNKPGKRNYLKRFIILIKKYFFHKKSIKYGLFIPLNVFDSGLSIAHMGCIVINQNCKIGKNCRIHETVTIGATGGVSDAPKIGNNVFIGTGAKIIGNITIADNVAIGAGAVVVKSITEPNTTWAGNPARKISNHDSRPFLNARLFSDNNKTE